MQLYTYARLKLYGNGFGRERFFDLLVKRTLKSVSRSTGARIKNNRWMGLIDNLIISSFDQGPLLAEEIKTKLVSYEKTHKQTCLRINLVIDLILSERGFSSETRGAVLTRYLPTFEETGQRDWITGCAEAIRMSMQSCGHFESSGDVVTFHGTEDTYDTMARVCQQCADTAQSQGVRVMDNSGYYILSQFAVDVRTYGGSTYVYDRRASNLTYDERRQFWHDHRWTPFAGLVEGYHSSKAKGFKLIESPWFKANRRAFGCELEVQVVRGAVDQAAGRVHEALNPSLNKGEYCFFERDGSIGEGFELITQPAGLDVHREKFGLFLNNKDIKKDMRSHEGGKCGFHVHVGREFLTQSQIYRVQSFLNDVRNEALIRAVARRYDSGYCKYKPYMAKFTPHNKNTGERYEALNVQNENTIEFRIFRGSLRYESIIAALEFCNALLTFCTPGVTSIMDFTSIGFKKFLMHPANRVDTKFLRSYLSMDADYDNERQAA